MILQARVQIRHVTAIKLTQLQAGRAQTLRTDHQQVSGTATVQQCRPGSTQIHWAALSLQGAPSRWTPSWQLQTQALVATAATPPVARSAAAQVATQAAKARRGTCRARIRSRGHAAAAARAALRSRAHNLTRCACLLRLRAKPARGWRRHLEQVGSRNYQCLLRKAHRALIAMCQARRGPQALGAGTGC